MGNAGISIPSGHSAFSGDAADAQCPYRYSPSQLCALFLLDAGILAHAPRGFSVGEPNIWWRLRSGRYLLNR